MNAELAQDRGAVIAENFPLVHKFVASQIPPGPVARAGGPEAAASALTPNYIVAVDAWLDRGDGRKLSTFVYKNLGHAWPRVLAKEANLVHIPVHRLADVVYGVSYIDPENDRTAAPEVDPSFPLFDEIDELRAAIAALKPRYRDVIRWRYLGHKTIVQIANEMRLSKQRIQQIEEAGLQALHRIILSRRRVRMFNGALDRLVPNLYRNAP